MIQQRVADILANPTDSYGEIGGGVHYFRLDHLDNPDQNLLVIGHDPDGAVKVHVYSRGEVRNRVQDLAADEPQAVFGHGTPSGHFRGTCPVPQEGEMGVMNTPPDGNSIQTKQEADFSKDAALLEKVKDMFASVAQGTCPAQWMASKENVLWPVFHEKKGDIVNYPFIVYAYTCNFGNYNLVQTTIPIKDPMLNAPKALRVCTTGFQFEDTRKVFLKHVVKSTKVGLSLGLGFTAKGKMETTGPKLGDKVYEGGQLKGEGEASQGGTFGLDLMRQHAKLKFEAWQRLIIDVGPKMFVCQEM